MNSSHRFLLFLLELSKCAKRNIFVAPLNLGMRFWSLGPCKEIRRVTSVWWIGPTVLRKVHFLHRKGQLCLLYSRLDRDIELWLLERTLWKVFFWEKRKNSKKRSSFLALIDFINQIWALLSSSTSQHTFWSFFYVFFKGVEETKWWSCLKWFERACLKGEGETKSSRRDRFIKSCSSNSRFHPFRGLAVVKTTKHHPLKPLLNGVDHSTNILRILRNQYKLGIGLRSSLMDLDSVGRYQRFSFFCILEVSFVRNTLPCVINLIGIKSSFIF